MPTALALVVPVLLVPASDWSYPPSSLPLLLPDPLLPDEPPPDDDPALTIRGIEGSIIDINVLTV